MNVKLASLKSDLAKEQDGAWIEIPELPGVALLSRSVHYQPYVRARDAALRRLQKRTEPVTSQEEAEITGTLYADHLLLGWRGFDEPYDADLARRLLVDPAYRDLRVHEAYAASQVGRAEVEFVEDARKNSAAPSAGA